MGARVVAWGAAGVLVWAVGYGTAVLWCVWSASVFRCAAGLLLLQREIYMLRNVQVRHVFSFILFFSITTVSKHTLEATERYTPLICVYTGYEEDWQ